MAGGCPSAGELSLLEAGSRGHRPVQGSGEGPLSYLPDPWAPSNLQGRDQKKESTTF